MEGLQRSTVSFRRQGSSGLVWDDRSFMSGELNKIQPKEQEDHQPAEGHGNKDFNVRSTRKNNPPPSINLERNQSNGGGRGYRTAKVQAAVEPPSPRVSACGFCGAFGRHGRNNKTSHRTKPGKRRSR